MMTVMATLAALGAVALLVGVALTSFGLASDLGRESPIALESAARVVGGSVGAGLSGLLVAMAGLASTSPSRGVMCCLLIGGGQELAGRTARWLARRHGKPA